MDRDSLYIASATGVDVTLPVAGAGSRSYAFLVDWHIRALLALAWFFVLTVIMVGSPGKLRDASNGITLVIVLPAALIYLLYHPVLEIAMRGRTPGKRLAGVRLVTREGGTPSTGALLMRNVFRLLDSLPAFYMVGLTSTLVTRDAVRIGDMAAGTLLVRDGADSVAALETLATVARDTTHDPVLIDVAHDLLRRWPQLEPERREALASALLARFGVAPAQGMDKPSLQAQLLAALAGNKASG
jgi:uncharacterized RDD family membrane protein YckC